MSSEMPFSAATDASVSAMRARVMAKMEVRSLAALVRMVDRVRQS